MNISKKEKIISAVIAFVVLAVIGVGVYAVITVTRTGMGDSDNRVNLNELAVDDVAIKSVDDSDGAASKQNEAADNSEAGGKTAVADNSDKDTSEKYEGDSKASENINNKEIAEKGDGESPEAQEPVADVNGNVRYNYLAKCSFSESDTLKWPVKGKVILQYSPESTIYFKTLGVYKTNPAISIAAEEGTNVGVVADGVVQSVSKSEETGTTVVVGIGDGYEVTYGMLRDVVVREGDIVIEEQLLGKVDAPTEYYAKEGSNIYFKVTKDGEPVNPLDYLEE